MKDYPYADYEVLPLSRFLLVPGLWISVSLVAPNLSSVSPTQPNQSTAHCICIVVWCSADVIPLLFRILAIRSLYKLLISDSRCLLHLHHLMRFWFKEFIELFYLCVGIFLYWTVISYTNFHYFFPLIFRLLKFIIEIWYFLMECLYFFWALTTISMGHYTFLKLLHTHKSVHRTIDARNKIPENRVT